MTGNEGKMFTAIVNALFEAGRITAADVPIAVRILRNKPE